MARILGCAAAALGVVLFFAFSWVLVERWTLVLLLVAAVPFLAWTAVREPARMARRCLAAGMAAGLFAAVPVDVWVIRTGQTGLGFDEVLWGLPWGGTATVPHRGLSAGCAPPLLNRTRYVLWVSY